MEELTELQGRDDVEMAPMNGQGNTYGQGNAYGRGNAHGQGNAYGQGGTYGRDPDGQTQQGAFAQPAEADPNAILNDCRDIDHGIESIRRIMQDLQHLQQQYLNASDMSAESANVQQRKRLTEDALDLNRNLVSRIRSIKSKPESASSKNSAQVGRIQRKLDDTLRSFRELEFDFQKQVKVQLERGYRIVNPAASEAEVQQAVDDTSKNQVFTQAVSLPLPLDRSRRRS